MTAGVVSAFRCPECGDMFLDAEGPLYECNNCGHRQVEERRCEHCNLFMARIADLCHGDCLSEEDLEEVEAWRDADGKLYESEAAEGEWIAGAPERVAGNRHRAGEGEGPVMKRYLGDAVYVDYDGYMLVLTTEDGINVTNTIYLEPKVYVALLHYIEDLRANRPQGQEGTS